MIAGVVSTAAMLGVYLSFTYSCHLPNYPGYFLLMTYGCLLFAFYSVPLLLDGSMLREPIALTTIGYWAWTVLSCCWASHPWSCAEGARRSTTFALLLLGSLALFRRRTSLRDKFPAVVFAALSITGVCYFAVWCREKLTGVLPLGFSFPFGNPNLAGAVFAFALLLALPFAFTARERRRFIGYSLLASYFGILLLISRSKGAILGAAIASTGALWLFFPRQRRRLLLLCVVAMVVFTVLLPWLLQKVWPSVEIRLFLWRSTWELVTDTFSRFAFGWGIGNFLPVYPDFESPPFHAAYQASHTVDYPHCYPLEITAEIGLVGLLLFVGILVASGYRAFHTEDRRQKIAATALFLGVVALISHSFVSVAFSYPHVQFLAAVACGWIAAAGKSRELRKKLVLQICIQSLALLLLALFWKSYAYDSLVFQLQYKRALRTMNYAQNRDNVVIARTGIEQLTAIEAPTVENHSTLHWRLSLGAAIVDYDLADRSAREKMAPFFEVEDLCPKFGTFLLKCAVYYARREKRQKADAYFRRYAAKNPFDIDLWILWAVACRYQQATLATMERTLQHYRDRYREDGGLMMAEAAIYARKRQFERAAPLMEKAHHWVLDKLKTGSHRRLLRIRGITAAFLSRHR